VAGEPPPDGAGLAGVVALLEGELPPLEGVVAPPDVVLVALVDVLLEVVVVAAATAGGAVGTVNGGAPAVSAVPVPPPPQAASPSPTAIESTIAGTARDLRAPRRALPWAAPR
jgi:hypothetical protein